MKVWGVEDIDFGLKAWSLGYGLKLDVLSRVAHRFQRAFDHYEVPAPHVLHNKLRLAAKHFSPHHLQQWLARNTPLTLEQLLAPAPDLPGTPLSTPSPGRPGEGRGEGLSLFPTASANHLPPLWRAALTLFHEHFVSLQAERTLVQSRRLRDELDYAHTFHLTWPGHELPQAFALAMTLPTSEETSTEPSPWPSPEPSPEPSPAPCQCAVSGITAPETCFVGDEDDITITGTCLDGLSINIPGSTTVSSTEEKNAAGHIVAIKRRVQWTTPGEHTLSATCGQSSAEKKIKVYKVQIFANDEDVTGGSVATVVGRPIALECRVTPKMEFTNEWVIPGIYVKKYSILYKPTGEQDRFGRLYTSVNTSGVVETFQEKNETCLPAIRLYWIKPLFRGEISVMVTIAGRSKSASAKPEISAPIVNIVPQTTTDVPPVFVDENVLKFGKISKGITVSALCATGSDGAGEFRFLQRVTFDRTVTRRQEFATQIRDSTERTRTTEWVLDRKDEIQDAWHFQNRSLHLNNIDAGGITMTDSPEITTLRTAISASVADETFDLRLMYRPDGEDSIWVSLKTVMWGWSAMASGIPAFSLAIIGNPVIKPINVEDSVDLPIWSMRALDVPLERSTVTTSR